MFIVAHSQLKPPLLAYIIDASVGVNARKIFDECLVDRCNRYDFILSDFFRCDFTAFFMFSVLCETLHAFRLCYFIIAFIFLIIACDYRE